MPVCVRLCSWRHAMFDKQPIGILDMMIYTGKNIKSIQLFSFGMYHFQINERPNAKVAWIAAGKSGAMQSLYPANRFTID